MYKTVVRTRIVVPRRRSDLLSRQRLLDLLDELLDYRLILVIAPAGYGKTFLLIDLAHQTEMPVCWYTVDSLDRELQRFLAHFIASIIQRFPTFGQQSYAALYGLATGQSSLDHLIATVVNELYAHVREHFVLVLDDSHLVDTSPDIGYFISQFIHQVDENCHLVLVSRALLSLPDLPLLVARAYVGGLSFEELAFRHDEIQALMLRNYGLSLSEPEAQALVSATEGWITGLLLSTQAAWQDKTGWARLARASGVGLYDYLAQQVLDQQPQPVRDFLLRTSLLEEFDAALCEAVLGPALCPPGESWQGMIETISRSNLFVLPVGDHGTWLRYHHLFQDFLQHTMARERPGETVAVLERLAAASIENQEWERAYHIYQQQNNQEAMAGLVEQAGSPLLRAGRILLLAEWLDALPAQIVSTRPGLLSLQGTVATVKGEVEEGLHVLNQAEAALRAGGRPSLLARTLVRRSVAHRFLGDYRASLADADEALALIEHSDRHDGEVPSVQAEGLRLKGLSLYMMGELRAGIQWLERAFQEYQAVGDAQNAAMLAMDIATAYSGAGHHAKALAQFQHALESWRGLNNLAWQANILNNLGVLYHLQGSYEQVLEVLAEALDCANRSGYTRVQALTLASMGDLFADLEATELAQQTYAHAYAIAQRVNERVLLLQLTLARAMLTASEGGTEQACELLETAARLTTADVSDYEWGLYCMATGRLHLIQGNGIAATAALTDATRCFVATGQRTEEAAARLYLADAWHMVGDQDRTLDCVAQVCGLLSELESWHPLVMAGRQAREVLEAVPHQAPCRQVVARLLRRIEEFEHMAPTLRRQLRQKASSLFSEITVAAARLKIRALGRAEVTLAGRSVSAGDWQTQTARDLFFCLLAHPEGLTKEAVGLIFWPDCSPAQLKVRFKNAIYRLRSALSADVILFEDNLYRFNRALDYEYDVELFLDKIDEASAATDRPARIAAYRMATELYRGDYLPDVDKAWAQLERERLRHIYDEAMLQLGELLLEAGEHGSALACCQHLLADDRCHEPAHRLAMRIHAAMSNRAAVVRQFEQCQQALREEIDVPPSAETEALYRLLMR